MVLDLHIEKNAICGSILKTISKLRDQISFRWQLTNVHSKIVGHSIRQSKVKGPLPRGAWVLTLRSFLVLPYWFTILLQQLQKNSQQLKFARRFLYYFVSWIGDNLLIFCCKTILLLFCLLNWGQFAIRLLEYNSAIKVALHRMSN